MSARCTFHIGPFYFGIPVEAVQEVLRGQTLTPVPLAPPAVKGLLNLRGDIVTVLDLSETLGGHPFRAGSPPLHVWSGTAARW
jgi:purine-binding chemotaxis protein CheW